MTTLADAFPRATAATVELGSPYKVTSYPLHLAKINIPSTPTIRRTLFLLLVLAGPVPIR
jgi:hypothetical protein